MSLKHFRVPNYRSLYDFELPLQSFTILIGRNDAGKSNVLRAMHLLLEDRATLAASKYDWSTVNKQTKSTRYPREISIYGDVGFNICRRVQIMKDADAISELLFLDGSDWRPITLDEKQSVPSFYYLRPRTGVLQEALSGEDEHNIFTLIKDWMPSSLSKEYDLDGLMRKYASTPNAMTAYVKFFDEQVYAPLSIAFPSDFPLIRFDIKFRGNEEKNLLIVRELTHLEATQARFRLPLESHGSALISITAMVLSIAVLQEYHKQKFGSKPMIIAIEEPEVHLHPGAQRAFLNYLKWMSSKHQMLITTHSPVLVDRAEPENVVVLRRTSMAEEKDDKNKTLKKAGATAAIFCDYRTNWREVTDTLDVRLSDALMMGEVNLLVEGPTEAIMLPAIGEVLLNRQEITFDIDRVFVCHGNGGNLPHIASILQKTGNPTVVMLDNDSEGLQMKKKLEGEENRVEEIFMPNIKNLKPPLNGLKEYEFEDLLNSKVLLHAFNEAYIGKDGFDFLPITFEMFEKEQNRLLGSAKAFGWVATVNSLIEQGTAVSSSKKKKEWFSKRTLAETAVKYIRDERLGIPDYFKQVFKKLEELFMN
ncbi:ATP-dependent nuclease [Tengunoibacter tsumagoiensis]|uniref:Uncharacterized protein n=1 Tax=Tengunoibacter tsumagoiensis TaxID=2014871 RepID=A0A401ZY74_9CHLR|nr:AAA family ATPase [Tengunoibacter tsumagoiensis]GCE11818.1 hypothetical protein KTT_16770 [Tengunoibacter tsumagoiensis]